MAGTGYEVDLEYLKATVTKLQGVVDGMDDTHNKANYETNLTRQQFGSDAFAEAVALHAAHDTMKNEILGMITTLKSMIQDFTNKTNQVHGAYTETETGTVTQMGRAQ